MTGHIHPCIMFSGFLSIALVIAIIVVIYLLKIVHESCEE
ncbi:hypothetical protein HDE69_002797 [Pedobacter cryoconitis]|uniref:Uncharacterized protein n=1 Tax=Pedobacter cryoconitis TaxID=188932 RepID=A0A7W8YTY3_9SPHI|nr:hypothetical protein [Pedobacter cryoconitis]